jgi:hypothetical protein
MNDTSALHGALLPVIRQAVQHFAGVILGAGVLSENETVAIAGLVMAVANVVWMLVARARAVPSSPPPAP